MYAHFMNIDGCRFEYYKHRTLERIYARIMLQEVYNKLNKTANIIKYAHGILIKDELDMIFRTIKNILVVVYCNTQAIT